MLALRYLSVLEKNLYIMRDFPKVVFLDHEGIVGKRTVCGTL